MEILKLTKDKYEEWDKFCIESDDAWFWHTSEWIEYTLNYNPEWKQDNFSFLVYEKEKLIAICPLVLEIIDKTREFSFQGVPGPLPAFSNGLSDDEKEKVLKFIFEQIDLLSLEHSVKRSNFRFSVLDKNFIEATKNKFNYLSRFGYLDISINTRVLNLKKDLEELKSDLRHGHSSDISRATKSLEVTVYDSKNLTKEIFDEYVVLKQKSYEGKKTRPQKTFDLMFEIVKERKAFLVYAKKDGKTVGISYFFLYKNNAYYGSSCSDKEFNKLPISHIIQWEAIKYLKSVGCNFYEIGWQIFSPSLSDFFSEKEINISKFKRGFGGETFPLFMGEKYYDRDYFLSVWKKRLEKFSETFDKKVK